MEYEHEIRFTPQNEQIVVDFEKLEIADLHYILVMIFNTTKLSTTPIEEAEFELLRQDFKGRGFASWRIKGHKPSLELIRILDYKGKPYVRVKIEGELPYMQGHTQAETKETVQELIDSHFIEKKTGVSARTINRNKPRSG